MVEKVQTGFISFIASATFLLNEINSDPF